MYRKVENEENLLKDARTSSVIETDLKSLDKYNKLKNAKRKLNNKIGELESRIDSMDEKLEKILHLLSR